MRQQQLHLIAVVEAGGANRAQRFARGAQVSRIGPLAVAFEMGARQHDGRSIRDVRQPARGRGRLDRVVELALVVVGARACQIDPGRLGGDAGRQSRQTPQASG